MWNLYLGLTLMMTSAAEVVSVGMKECPCHLEEKDVCGYRH